MVGGLAPRQAVRGSDCAVFEPVAVAMVVWGKSISGLSKAWNDGGAGEERDDGG